jgi:acetoin utilization deacetylase AcuC-like enzyme
LCRGKLVAVLEGGYNLKIVGRIAVGAVAEMAGAPFNFVDSPPQPDSRIMKQGERVIDEVRKIHSAYWKLS